MTKTQLKAEKVYEESFKGQGIVYCPKCHKSKFIQGAIAFQEVYQCGICGFQWKEQYVNNGFDIYKRN